MFEFLIHNPFSIEYGLYVIIFSVLLMIVVASWQSIKSGAKWFAVFIPISLTLVMLSAVYLFETKGYAYTEIPPETVFVSSYQDGDKIYYLGVQTSTDIPRLFVIDNEKDTRKGMEEAKRRTEQGEEIIITFETDKSMSLKHLIEKLIGESAGKFDGNAGPDQGGIAGIKLKTTGNTLRKEKQ